MPHLYNRLEYNQTRRALRNSATPTEVKLWHYLRNRNQLGYKFRRQHGIGRYIVDFYCPELKLAIEVDGGHHFTGSIHADDHRRDAWLQHLGIAVVRFTSAEVMNNIDGLLLRLHEIIKSRAGSKTTPDLRSSPPL